jgi:hypothetical protein
VECSIAVECSTEVEGSIDVECSIDMNIQHGYGMQYGRGHAAWTWTRSTDLVVGHGPGQWTCINAWIQNADIKSSVRHR